MRRFALVLALLATTGCVQQIKSSRVRSALIDAGLPETLSQCMASRMASKLTIRQLRGLQRLGRAPRNTLAELLAALRANGDADAIEVTASSAALCSTGFVR